MAKSTNGQREIVNAFTFELSKVETTAVRTKVLGHLDIIDTLLGIHKPVKAPETLEGRKIGALIADGFDAELVSKLRAAVETAGAVFELVASTVGMTTASDGTNVTADHMIQGGPSVIFDAVVVIANAASVRTLLASPSALDWVSDAFVHCKVIGAVAAAMPLLEAAHVKTDEGVIDLASKGVAVFIEAAKRGRIWAREQARP